MALEMEMKSMSKNKTHDIFVIRWLENWLKSLWWSPDFSSSATLGWHLWLSAFINIKWIYAPW